MDNIIFIIYKGRSDSPCNILLNEVWKLYSKYLLQNKILPLSIHCFLLFSSLNTQAGSRALSSVGKTVHHRERQQYHDKGDGMGQGWGAGLSPTLSAAAM